MTTFIRFFIILLLLQSLEEFWIGSFLQACFLNLPLYGCVQKRFLLLPLCLQSQAYMEFFPTVPHGFYILLFFFFFRRIPALLNCSSTFFASSIKRSLIGNTRTCSGISHVGNAPAYFSKSKAKVRS